MNTCERQIIWSSSRGKPGKTTKTQRSTNNNTQRLFPQDQDKNKEQHTKAGLSAYFCVVPLGVRRHLPERHLGSSRTRSVSSDRNVARSRYSNAVSQTRHGQHRSARAFNPFGRYIGTGKRNEQSTAYHSSVLEFTTQG